MPTTQQDLLYKIGVSLIPGIGCINAKKLIAYSGSIEGVFRQKKAQLLKIPGIGAHLAESISKANVLKKAEKEVFFIEDKKITPLFYLDED
jgi:DNA processing protein